MVMKTQVQTTKSGKGALITVLETDEEIADRQRKRRQQAAARRSSGLPAVTISQTTGNSAVRP
jgi:hypothetical protein